MKFCYTCICKKKDCYLRLSTYTCILGDFMQADMDVTVNVRLEGTMAELLINMDPKLYWQYVRNKRGKTVLYVELLKALYGTLRAALLFWKLLSKKLVEWGFEINPLHDNLREGFFSYPK